MNHHKKLSLKEREELFQLLAQNLSIRKIAKRLNRHHLTISRELKPNLRPYILVTTARNSQSKRI